MIVMRGTNIAFQEDIMHNYKYLVFNLLLIMGFSTLLIEAAEPSLLTASMEGFFGTSDPAPLPMFDPLSLATAANAELKEHYLMMMKYRYLVVKNKKIQNKRNLIRKIVIMGKKNQVRHYCHCMIHAPVYPLRDRNGC